MANYRPASKHPGACHPPAAENMGVKSWRYGFLPLTLDRYLELLDRTGRQLIAGKRGAIDPDLVSILERLGYQSSL